MAWKSSLKKTLPNSRALRLLLHDIAWIRKEKHEEDRCQIFRWMRENTRKHLCRIIRFWTLGTHSQAQPIVHYLHTVPPSSPSKLGLELQQSLHQQMVYHLRSLLTKHRYSYYSYYTWDTQLTHPTPPSNPQPLHLGAMSIFKDLLDPQHRRRRLRHPVEYTDVEAAEALQPQKELAVLLREVSGGDGVEPGGGETMDWSDEPWRFLWEKEELPGLVNVYSLRTWK